MRRTVAALALAPLLLGGCAWGTALDKKITAAHQDWYSAASAYVDLRDLLWQRADEMARKKHDIQAAYTEEQLRVFREANKGKTVPMETVDALLAQVRQRDADLAESRKAWEIVAAAATQSSKRQKSLSELMAAKEAEWAEFRKAAKATYDELIQSLVGVASGAAGLATGAAVK